MPLRKEIGYILHKPIAEKSTPSRILVLFKNFENFKSKDLFQLSIFKYCGLLVLLLPALHFQNFHTPQNLDLLQSLRVQAPLRQVAKDLGKRKRCLS